jgi:DNA polymerase-3 subunit epsilon
MTGYAVIDFETTGLFPSHDRVVEVAVVHVDETGTITGQWDTLVNPRRDIGAQRIHHISAAEILDAPTFAQIAPRLVELLSGRVVVAHNASFDTRFLYAELERIGYIADLRDRSLCTMQLAREFLPGAGRSLEDCCAAYDIQLDGAHRASVDALATAHLLAAYIAHRPMWQEWGDHLASAAATWPPIAPTGIEWTPRGTLQQNPASFLQRITVKLPEYSGPVDHLDYLDLLDRVLLDRQISVHEANSLVDLAESHGISRTTCAALHREYFEQLTAVAWADGQLTTDEIGDLADVAKLLSIPGDVVLEAMQPREVASDPVAPDAVVGRFELVAGDLIVLTGAMRRLRDEWYAILEDCGLLPWPAVTKKVKLVVAADGDSLSGKAAKARDYGIPIVDETWLEHNLPLSPASTTLIP